MEDGQLLHAHRVAPLVEVPGQAHPPELLEHPRTIGRGDTEGDRHAAAVREHGPVHGAADGMGHLAERRVSLPDLYYLLLDVERPHFPVEQIAVALQ